MADQEPTTSPYRWSRLYVDPSLLRDRPTIYYGDYPHLSYNDSVTCQVHVAKATETLEMLATIYYGNPSWYWIIADFQPSDELPIFAPHEPLEEGRSILIPPKSIVRLFQRS